jgi:SAM-dependent methyltransferase
MNDAVNKDERKCPCCSGSSTSMFDDGPYPAFHCNDCDHVWYDSARFDVDQNSYENSDKYETYYVGKPPFLWYHRRALQYFQRMASSKRVLDFGCFDGFFTAKLLEAGVDAYGSDWNRKAIAYGRRAHRLGDRLSRDPDGLYDAIVALEVIEHFTDPNDFLDMVLAHLTPDGALILSCPNKNSLYRPKTDAPPHHFSRFSQKSLVSLLVRHGLEVEIHEREMSTFQLLRNFLGDTLRRDALLLNNDAKPKIAGRHIHVLKLVANAIANTASLVLRPVDSLFHALGFSYFSQFVVAKRTTVKAILKSEAG